MDVTFEKPYKVMLGNADMFRIILVGCGGTGGYIAETVARFAWDLKQVGKRVHIVFIDHDLVEENNIGRQRFAPAELGLNKAICLANRYNLAFGLEIVAVERPFSAEMLSLWRDRFTGGATTLLVGAVDNAEARQEMAKAVEAENGRLWCLDAGNAFHNGNVYLGNLTKSGQLKLDSEMMLASGFPSPFVQDPALLVPEKKHAVKETEERSGSCAMRIMRREQSMVINQQMGSLLGRYLECWLVERELTFMHTAVSLHIPAMQTTMATGESLRKA